MAVAVAVAVKMSEQSSFPRVQLVIHRSEDDPPEELDLPVLPGTHGPSVLDVRGLYARSGFFTHDPGFTTTSSCESAITFIDGDAGVLLHRGYTIEQLAAQSTYTEVCYLLLNGELPTAEQLEGFEAKLTNHRMVDEKFRRFFDGFPDQAHPMGIMVGVCGALSCFYTVDKFKDVEEEQSMAAIRLIAKMPTLAAMAYKRSLGRPFVYPLNRLNYSENFLRMMFASPCEEYQVNPVVAKAMDTILILHADHEQNASTSTVRIAGSSEANPFACIASGITSLWGPMHGGANEAVIRMLSEIGHADRIPEFLERAKSKTDPFKLMGFGHRVYKNFDPRAIEMKKMCHEVIAALGGRVDPVLGEFLALAIQLEQAALQDDYFVKRKLFPNVDFYSGITLTAIGIPVEMFTVIFAMARTVGWIAQWKESMHDQPRRISRPRQLYTGAAQREFQPLALRCELRGRGESFSDDHLVSPSSQNAEAGGHAWNQLKHSRCHA